MKLLKFLPLFLCLGIFSLPAPSFVSLNAWKVFVLFFSTILGLVLKSLPMGGVGILAITVGGFFGVFSIKEAMGAFGSSLVWQVVSVFFIAKAFVKTGLSNRIAYHIIKLLGKTPLGLGYGFALANTCAGPLVPSSAARVGGILFPIVQAISRVLGSSPEEKTEKKIGSFFTMICLYSNGIVASTFMTAMAGNLVSKAVAASQGINITWFTWFSNAIVPFLICIALMPLVLYYVYPPEISDISGVRSMISEELKKLGKLSFNEKSMIFILFSILAGWVFGESIGLDSLLVTFLGVSSLLVLNILDFEKDVLDEKEAWHTLIWLAVLVMLAQKLETSGFLDFVVNNIEYFISGFAWPLAFAFLILVYFYSHYFFASNTSHISAMYGVFLSVALKAGVPPMLAALSIAYASTLFTGLTYYSSTEAVILYNSKYVSMKDFFRVGIIMSSFLLVTWFSVGAVWWKFLGTY